MATGIDSIIVRNWVISESTSEEAEINWSATIKKSCDCQKGPLDIWTPCKKFLGPEKVRKTY